MSAGDVTRVGYWVSPPLLSREELERVERECHGLVGDERWTLLGAAQNSGTLHRFARHEVFRGIVEPLLSSDVDLYWDSIVRKPAGHGREFRWHQDGGYGRTEPEGYITCWTPLAATSEENGCLWVVPGSHLAGMLPHDSLDSTAHAYSGLVADLPADAAPVPLPMEPGQVAVLHSFTLHRSGPNRSASPRTAYVAAYTRAGTRYLDPGLPSDAKAPAFRATGA